MRRRGGTESLNRLSRGFLSRSIFAFSIQSVTSGNRAAPCPARPSLSLDHSGKVSGLVYLPVRKNSLFAGHDEGAVNWACLASLIETAKIHGIDPQAYLADILAKLVNGWPMQKLDELLPWAWADQNRARLAA